MKHLKTVFNALLGLLWILLAGVAAPVFLLKLVTWDNKAERNRPHLVAKHTVQFQNGQFQQGLESVIRGHQVTEHQGWEQLPGCEPRP